MCAQNHPPNHLDALMASAKALRVDHPELAPTLDEFAAVMRELQPAWADYTANVSGGAHAISLGTAAYLLHTCRAIRARRVLDLGSGFSSYVLALYAATAPEGVAVVSVDTDTEWLARTGDYLNGLGVSSELVAWPEFTARQWEPFDVVLHDLANGDTREAAMSKVCGEWLAVDGVAIMDDAHHVGHYAAMVAAAGARMLGLYSLHEWTMDNLYRFAALVTRRVSTLDDRYRAAVSTPSDIWLHLPRFADIVTETNARHVVELGTRSGVSTVGWLHALTATGGRLTSVDLDPAPDIGHHEHWTFIQGDDLSPDVVRAVSTPPPDVVFIDTSHHYRQTVAELNTYRFVVRTGGFIVCHDTGLERPENAPIGDPPYPVRKAVTEFCSANGFRWVDLPDCWGLAVIRIE